jgi:hypothetical protein
VSERHPWTPAEDQKLRTLVGGYAWPAIARILERSIKSCQGRAEQLKLRHVGNPDGKGGWFTVEDLCEVLGVDRGWVENRLRTGALVGQEIGGEPRVSGETLREYIRRCPREVSGRPLDMVVIVDLFSNFDAEK